MGGPACSPSIHHDERLPWIDRVAALHQNLRHRAALHRVGLLADDHAGALLECQRKAEIGASVGGFATVATINRDLTITSRVTKTWLL